MNDPQDWLDEAHLRLRDGRSLLNDKRYARSVTTAYFALHAAGKGLFLTRDVEIKEHPALYKMISLHFVKAGDLPDDTAKFMQWLYEQREQADYYLERFTEREAASILDDTRSRIQEMEALLT